MYSVNVSTIGAHEYELLDMLITNMYFLNPTKNGLQSWFEDFEHVMVDVHAIHYLHWSGLHFIIKDLHSVFIIGFPYLSLHVLLSCSYKYNCSLCRVIGRNRYAFNILSEICKMLHDFV